MKKLSKMSQGEEKKALVKVASELNKVMPDLEPPINTKVAIEGEEGLREQIREASTFLAPEDELSEEIKAYLVELGFIDEEGNPIQSSEEEEPEAEEEVEAEPEEEAEEEVEEPEAEEEVEEPEDEPEELSLRDQIKASKKLNELKEIVKAEEIFAPLVKKLPTYKFSQYLKKDMLALMAPAKAEKVEKPKEKADKKEKTPRVTKKSIIEEMIATKSGATIEEMAKQMVDRGVDADYEKNCLVTKLWLSKMGFDTKKSTIEKNPKFKK